MDKQGYLPKWEFYLFFGAIFCILATEVNQQAISWLFYLAGIIILMVALVERQKLRNQ